MTFHPAEEATIRAFVASSKREWFLGQLSRPDRRAQALNSLNHFYLWDERYVQPLHSSTDVFAALKRAGAPDMCHIISGEPELDGQELGLAEAVVAAEMFSFASLLCCVPGQIACYFDEVAPPRRRLLLVRRK